MCLGAIAMTVTTTRLMYNWGLSNRAIATTMKRVQKSSIPTTGKINHNMAKEI